MPNRLAWILDHKIAPLIIAQHQSAATLRAKICHRNRLRPEVKSKNASYPRHDSKVPNPKCQGNLKLEFSTPIKLVRSRFFIERFWVLLLLCVFSLPRLVPRNPEGIYNLGVG